MDAVVAAAAAAGADAIHPGYGFLAENPRLARACEAAGIVFIGPGADVLEAAGDKLAARAHAVAAGLPVLPGGWRGSGRMRRACGSADAAGWQGGSGIRCWSRRPGAAAGAGCGWSGIPGELAGAVAVGSAEAQAAFGDARVYLERYVSPARHVEVQLLGDGENVIHLGDRDCSVQRRYQKLIEEAPAPRLGETLRVGMRAAAVALGLHLKYQGLGTVEFLVDARAVRVLVPRGERAHPGGAPGDRGGHRARPGRRADRGRGGAPAAAVPGQRAARTATRSSAGSTRKTPAAGFRPSPGTVTSAVFPAGPGIRVDTHIQAGSAVPPQYDSLLAKLIVSGASRAEALDRLRGALARCEIGGVATTLPAARGAGRRRRVRRRGRRHGVPGAVAGAGNPVRSGS